MNNRSYDLKSSLKDSKVVFEQWYEYFDMNYTSLRPTLLEYIKQISLQHNFICWNCTGKKYTCEELVKGHWTFFISLYEYNLTVFRSFSNQYYKQAGLQCTLIKGVRSVEYDDNNVVFLNFQPWASLWNQAKWCLC